MALATALPLGGDFVRFEEMTGGLRTDVGVALLLTFAFGRRDV